MEWGCLTNKKLILASASPRRAALLEMAGIPFEVCVSHADERIDPGDPARTVQAIAERKAADVRARCGSGTVILAADTVVYLDGKILGKPVSEEEAFSMLSALSGRRHTVYTGVCIAAGNRYLRETVQTEVTFRPLPEREIRSYIAAGEPMDKAGAYGIQGPGALFVARVEGDFYNVMGLPLVTVYRMLGELGAAT